ncbi:site-specific integrase [Virgibacillus sp. YIM 98842]|uniref:tyrosine-type recombinase/integrase n=1 Tax=Virgibacillus sp. YIM 98842 TaxID=2663533 RepID=UPI0013D9BF28|nr:site-specific integrase [Virgibacillus sp. YIM 98842]
MAGSIQDRGNGKYYLTVSAGFDGQGKRIRKTKTVTAKSPADARKKLALFVAEVERKEYVSPSNTKFRTFVELWKKRAKKQLAPKTMELYTYLLDSRMIPAFGNIRLENITLVRLNDYMEKLEEEGLSSNTRLKHYNLFNNLFNLALKLKLISENPMDGVDRPKREQKETNVYDSQELKRLFLLLNEEKNKQMVLMVKLALKTGMRKGELLGLRWEDVDFATNTIHVRHSLSYTKEEGYQIKDTKTKNSNRKVAPPKKLMKELQKHIHHKREEKAAAAELWDDTFGNLVFSTPGKSEGDTLSLFGKPIHQDSPNRWWRRFLDRVNAEAEKNGQSKLKKIRFHDLRHTAATDLINKNAHPNAISKRLGHANISTTINIYGHHLEEADQKIADMLDEDYI